VLSPQQRTIFPDASDGDRKSTRSVTSLTITVRSAPLERNSFAGHTDIQQATVTFDATCKKVTAGEDGPQLRSVYAGRRGSSEPWRKAGIGIGP
jgi:hypothetical protein